jgi:hypothetical protein
MPDHPMYAMWKARYDADLATRQERAVMRADREAKRAAWGETWRAYLARGAAEHYGAPAPPWWNLAAWWTRLRAGRPLGT